MRTIVIGLGNPVVTDDGVGPIAARLIDERLPEGVPVNVTEVYAGGMELMDVMEGYERAVIIDAMKTGLHAPGSLHRLGFSEMISSRNTDSTHNGSLEVALETGRLVGLDLPEDVTIWGIEAEDVKTFGESLTEKVAQSLPDCVEIILDDILTCAHSEGRLEVKGPDRRRST